LNTLNICLHMNDVEISLGLKKAVLIFLAYVCFPLYTEVLDLYCSRIMFDITSYRHAQVRDAVKWLWGTIS
jgi:hypothetical protein